ncbi:hypothetical protein BJF80_08520 [Serinicoccus sp. CUA-874]|nr:hypothetical protein BJF80_08520 [Serinicoccus sp. CUA-874]
MRGLPRDAEADSDVRPRHPGPQGRLDLLELDRVGDLAEPRNGPQAGGRVRGPHGLLDQRTRLGPVLRHDVNLR